MILQMKKYLVGGGILLAIVVLLGWGKIFSDTPTAKFWKDTQVACLPNGHEKLAMHIHQNFLITVDGVKEGIPANIGVGNSCMSEVHTHDSTGKIHIEAVTAGKVFTLADFFVVWGKPIERGGHTLAMTVNGVTSTELGAFVLADNQKIVLAYVSTPPTATTTP